MSINLVALEESLDRGTATRAVSTARSHRARNVAPVGHGSESISRSELKFSISEDKAARIREAASLVMARDPHCSTEGSYEVHTVYLDSPDMTIYRKSLNREADRFKLSMRFYDDDHTSPVFLEIKRTANGRGIKKRFAVDRESANSLFSFDNVSDASNSTAFAEYSEIVSLFNARPIIHIGYVREALVGKDNPGTRLTLDRMIRCQPAPTTLTTAMQNPIQIWQGKVILEIKFVGEIPTYLHDLIRSFGLEAAKASKYMESASSRFAFSAHRHKWSPETLMVTPSRHSFFSMTTLPPTDNASVRKVRTASACGRKARPAQGHATNARCSSSGIAGVPCPAIMLTGHRTSLTNGNCFGVV